MAWFRKVGTSHKKNQVSLDGRQTRHSPSEPEPEPPQSFTQVEDEPARETVVFDSSFRGLIAPVFTCFKNDERRSLDVRPINRYAEWLERHMISGILINGVVGEGPLMRVRERKANCEYWQRAALRHNLMVMVQVGGAPLPDVLSLAAHAEEVRVSGVVLLPELLYRPRNVDQLICYCKHVASRCSSRPFFYYHMPSMTGVDLDMAEFCSKAEDAISNFMGVYYASGDLEMGQRCLRFRRVVILASTALLASGLLCGFCCTSQTVLNMRPDLVHKICTAFANNQMQLVREYQSELNQLIEIHTHSTQMQNWVASMKSWFNIEFTARQIGNFTAGPTRIFY